MVRIGVIIENTEPMKAPGREPCASISRSTSSGVSDRVQTLMKPWPARFSRVSAWKSIGVMVSTIALTVSG